MSFKFKRIAYNHFKTTYLNRRQSQFHLAPFLMKCNTVKVFEVRQKCQHKKHNFIKRVYVHYLPAYDVKLLHAQSQNPSNPTSEINKLSCQNVESHHLYNKRHYETYQGKAQKPSLSDQVVIPQCIIGQLYDCPLSVGCFGMKREFRSCARGVDCVANFIFLDQFDVLLSC